MLTVDGVGTALTELRARIAAAGGGNVTVVAVAKGFGVEAWAAARAAGLDDVGESYAQEAAAKATQWSEGHDDAPPRLHFVGRLQTNKVRVLAGRVALWQSVDRAALVDELARRDPGAALLIQVDISGEQQKGGCAPFDAPGLVARARAAGLDVRGLMGIGPAGDPLDARAGFARLRGLTDDLGLTVCSMGMTADVDVAVGEGSTMVRVGTGLFGPRPEATGLGNYVAVRRQQ